MSQVVYNIAKNRMAGGTLVLTTASGLECLLLKTTAAGAFNPDIDTVSALLAVGSVAEADFTNYARKSLGTPTATEDDTNDRSNVDAANITWTAAGGATNNTPVALVIYQTGGSDAARNLVAYYDTNFGSVATNGGDFTVNISDFLRIA